MFSSVSTLTSTQSRPSRFDFTKYLLYRFLRFQALLYLLRLADSINPIPIPTIDPISSCQPLSIRTFDSNSNSMQSGPLRLTSKFVRSLKCSKESLLLLSWLSERLILISSLLLSYLIPFLSYLLTNLLTYDTCLPEP